MAVAVPPDDFDRLCTVAGPVSRETYGRLRAFERQFEKWAARINLAAPSTLGDIWTRHILDSAQLLPLAPEGRSWVDLGSGGGFPGAVLAILLQGRSGVSVMLVESNRKKAAFLQNVLAELAPGARVVARRIEEATRSSAAPDIVTARALAPLDRLLQLAEPWLAAGSRALFHKGRDSGEEIKVVHDTWNLDLVEHRSAIDEHSVILEITRASRRQA
ncbi:16S rRNA (guanine(527)-N(7))-methyltransferase RsmG [Nitratireductor mangrovi]|uniref:Ribosomal RNA small subunit methyltransferase G n=1 Tax=Nitratireductor mangrovi TaxID=2599600 RepID=A0A5B8L2R0_9HYPH|nr:16S rRNA (guanine(527)-N(7))-methyltransferase RsmG [Nitratireductor mangrovi]QDZ01838.1 16S rRNA (guanine(527)-N(7))-methyltransferase RsmG [Nitratireductor mangrovi]